MADKRRLRVLDRLVISEPCEVEWDAMEGGERVRHCARCEKPVYNIAAMTRSDADRFVREQAGRACIRMVRADDGRVVTVEDDDVDLPVAPRGIGAPARSATRTRVPRTALDLIALRSLVVRASFAIGAFPRTQKPNITASAWAGTPVG